MRHKKKREEDAELGRRDCRARGGEMNLFMQSCCMISPAMLIPTPVHKIASRRGRREARKICHWSASACKSPARLTSITPIKREATLRTASKSASATVTVYFFIFTSLVKNLPIQANNQSQTAPGNRTALVYKCNAFHTTSPIPPHTFDKQRLIMPLI